MFDMLYETAGWLLDELGDESKNFPAVKYSTITNLLESLKKPDDIDIPSHIRTESIYILTNLLHFRLNQT